MTVQEILNKLQYIDKSIIDNKDNPIIIEFLRAEKVATLKYYEDNCVKLA